MNMNYIHYVHQLFMKSYNSSIGKFLYLQLIMNVVNMIEIQKITI